MNEKQLRPNLIFETVTGSNSYGTATAESDLDTRGIVLSPKTHVFGMERFDQFDGFKGDDKVWYELRFAFNLMANNNPNMIDFLYTSRKNWLHTTPVWEKVVANRDLFLSKKAKFTYSGYAVAQLRRIKSHRGWLFNPVEEPKRKAFGLPENSKNIPKEQMKAIIAIEPRFIESEVREEAMQEMKYATARKEWHSYDNWKKNRNPKRAKLEAKCGYDSKHASHLIRLMRMGKEILSEGKVIVDRTGIDADYLLDIRQGNVDWKDIIEEVKRVDIELEELYKTSTLPRSSDRKKINDLAIEIYEEFFNGKN